MIDSVPLIQNANDVQQINASIIAMKKASRELDEKIVKLNSLNSELDKKIALLDSGLNKEIEDRKEAINSLDVPSVGGSGKYISAISETDGKINATASNITSTVSSGNNQPVTSDAVAEQLTIATSSDSTPYVQRVNADKDKSFINKLTGASFAVNQLVKNGNFANTSNWSATVATISASGNVLSVTATANNGYAQQYYPLNHNHKYLVQLDCKAQTIYTLICRMYFGSYSGTDQMYFNAVSTNWTTYAKVIQTASTGNIRELRLYTATSGQTNQFRNVMIIDLTQMFGSDIADRIYAMEQASFGSGVAWIKSFGFFNKSYYETGEGSLQNVKPSACRTTGFNIARSWINGSVSTQYTTALFIDCELRPNTTYCIGFKGANNNKLYHNENLFKNGFSQIVANGQYQYYLLTTKDDISSQYNAGLGYVILKNNAGNSVTPNFTQVCVSLADSRFNGQYEKYKGEWNYPLANTELRGIPKLDANNNLYFDGDIYYPNGDVIRKYASLTNQSGAVGGTITLTGYKTNGNIICSKGAISNIGTISGTTLTLTSAISGETIIYELATPTKETVAGYSNPHTLIRKGVEEFVDDRTIPLPVGHETEYAKLPSWLSNNVIFL